MKVEITPSALSGEICAPPSKSCMHRTLICAAAAETPTKIYCNSFSKDIQATISCLSQLGAKFEYTESSVTVYPIDRSAKNKKECILDCNESGSTLRFMLPFAAALGRKCTFVGAERLGKRPLIPLCEALEKHGVSVCYEESFLPCRIEGTLSAGKYEIPGDISSQFVTGLLLALGLCGGGEICVEGPLQSAPYVDITLDIQKAFGVNTEKTENGYKISEDQKYSSPGEFIVEGDYSNAAFWMVSGAIGSEKGIICTSLFPGSSQGDKKIEEILIRMGADIKRSDDHVYVKKSVLKATQVDCGDIPDLVPVLCVAASAAEGTTVFKNIQRLRAKESDRVKSTADMINSLGGRMEYDEDTIYVTGTKLSGGMVDSCNDHRIAMSAAAASQICCDNVTVIGAEAVNKSYPDFFEKFSLLGGNFNEL